MDGAPNNGQAGNNNIAYVPIVDAVQEFSVQQNSYDAQYGKTGGGVFNVVLKSGTPEFHATGWWFLRRRSSTPTPSRTTPPAPKVQTIRSTSTVSNSMARSTCRNA